MSWSSVSIWYSLFAVVVIVWGVWVVALFTTLALIVLPLNDKPIPAALCVLVDAMVSLFALFLVTVTFVPPAISTSSFVPSEPSNLIFVVFSGTNKS